mgnify:CR=1 FL=1|tara:strand:+ start:59 stop:364 length:306 start_codon:yes stop_codon:yes gene_type:complete
MVLEEITYFLDGKKIKIKAKVVNSFNGKFKGLMFRKNSPPLLFIFKKEKKLSIHSLFCRPFRAIWLDKNMKATKIVDDKGWKLNLSGRGKYLLEIPSITLK